MTTETLARRQTEAGPPINGERPRFRSGLLSRTHFVDLTPIPTDRLRQRDTLVPEKVITNLLSNSIAFLDTKGNIHRIYTEENEEGVVQYYKKKTSDGEKEVVLNRAAKVDGTVQPGAITFDARRDIDALVTVPKSPYGPEHVMICDVKGGDPQTIVDLPNPTEAQRDKLAITAQLLEAMMDDGEPVYVGNNVSPACLDGISLQSVLYPHLHLWKFSKELNFLTIDHIRNVRKMQRWDNGISRAIGEGFKDAFADKILPTYQAETGKEAEIEVDPMGVTIELPGVRPDDFANEEFVDTMVVPLYKIMDEQIASLHRTLFKSEYKNVVDFINRERKTGEITQGAEKDYNRLFELKDPEPGEPDHITQLRQLELDGKLRHPLGWAIGWQFRKVEGEYVATVAITPVPFNEKGPAGTVEGFGVTLDRKETADDTSSEDRKIYEGLREKAFALAA